ncbi:3-isopropylmalate dehydratase small subunit [Saccharothrix sp. Mg75]|uniref:3-isopropylmalate dehydratase small subunit n=1 Tax=Saccharothrix sp. Mg75 TaxID=3445357 RepID=UPI003EE86FDB
MLPLTEHTGTAVPLARSDVDTDQIIPSDHCRRLTKTGFAPGLFAQWRQEEDFVLNQPRYAGATVLVAERNFGTGSSREPAVWALRDWGFAVVVAEGFGDIFERNALKNGLLTVRLPTDAVTEVRSAVEADPTLPVTVDLVALEVRLRERRWSFDVDAHARRLLLDGLDEIDLTLSQEDAIAAYERGRPHWLAPRPAGVR